MKKAPSPRLRRVNSMLRHAVAEIVHELKDPRLGFVTVTGVDTSPDLHTARVYYSVLGDEDAKAHCAEALASAAGHIRGEVGHRVRLKYTPELIFEPDYGIEQGTKIAELLRTIETEDEES